MKIAAISASRIPAKTANSIQVMKACQALVQLNHEITLYVPRFNNGKTQGLEPSALYGLQASFPIRYLPALPVFHRHDFAWAAALQARNSLVDLVVAWPIQAALASLSFSLPTIIEMHGPPEGKFGPSIFKLFLARSGKKRLVFISQSLKQMVEKDFPGLDITPISIIAPNGVELERYAGLPDPASARKQLNIPEQTTAAYSGHLYPGRGMSMLVELARRLPNLQFLWIGGREKDIHHWEGRLTEESISNVRLMGFISNDRLPLFQAAADILLMPYERVITGSSGGNSAAYASPMKMFEYMACRRPIISSDLPVLREVLNPENALLCPPEDQEAWTENLRMLVKNEPLRNRLAERAYRDAANYTWEKRAKKILSGFLND